MNWWILNVGQVTGIPVRIHITFWILPLILLAGSADPIQTVGMILIAFGSIILHELGHALMARHYGIKSEHITILPIGAVVLFEKAPQNALEEFMITLAGPSVNLFLAIIASIVFLPFEQLAPTYSSIIEWLSLFILINTIILLFNLIPAYPMDGGKILRSILWARSGNFHQATKRSTVVGGFFGFLGILASIWTGNIFLGVIAIFVILFCLAENNVSSKAEWREEK